VRILSENSIAQKYNEFLGYIQIPGQADNNNQWYLLTKESFNRKSEKIRKSARLFTETDGKMKIDGSESHLNLPEVNKSLGLLIDLSNS